MTAVPIAELASASEIALLPRAWLLAGRGESPVQSTYPGILFGVHSLLGVVALRGLLCLSPCNDSRFRSLVFSLPISWKSVATMLCDRSARLNSLIGRDAERFCEFMVP